MNYINFPFFFPISFSRIFQLTHQQGVDIATSFMFLAIGIVPLLVSTVAFLPKSKVPWPLPSNYGERRQCSLDENTLRKQRAWQRRLSGNSRDQNVALSLAKNIIYRAFFGMISLSSSQ